MKSQLNNKKSISPNNIGTKANGLMFLRKNGFQVPSFFVIDFDTIDLIIKDKRHIKNWLENQDLEKDTLWAVRSSANMEDGEHQSFAGLFKTITNVNTTSLPDAIENVIQAFIDFNELEYKPVDSLKFAVIVQRMICSEYSGVIFSHNPLDIREKAIFINIIPGLGENLVSGKEEAFSIKYKDDKLFYLNNKKEFNGSIYTSGLQSITKSEETIKANITPFLDQLIDGTNKLSRLKKKPVDIEFTIADGQLFWLQIRPITSSEPEPLTVWDNASIIENYPGITLPLSISFVRYTYSNAYSAMAAFLGMHQSQIKRNANLFNNMVGEIYGGLYYHVTAWQQLLYQLPFGERTSKKITKIWGMDNAEFEKVKSRTSFLVYIRLFINLILSFVFFRHHKLKFEATYKKAFSEYGEKDFKSTSRQKLISDFKKINKELGEKWIVPVLNGFFAFLLFSILQKTINKSRLFKNHPNFINDILYSQGDVISVKIVRAFQHLINTILGNSNLKKMFKDEPEDKIIAILSSEYPDFKKQIDSYIQRYGERCGSEELKIEKENYRENPISFITFLKANAVGTYKADKESLSYNYKQVLKKNYKYNPFKIFLLSALISITLKRIKDRENYRFYRTKSFDIIRRIFRALDRNLHKERSIENPGDTLYLVLDELVDNMQISQYKSMVKKRKILYDEFENIKRAKRYYQTSRGFYPADTIDFIENKSKVKGVGCSSGIVTEKIIIITSNKVDITKIEGKILVANYFEPGWINVFSKAAGIISERGSLLTHTAILCREMGIPAIVGAKGILSVVKNEQMVHMNGATGEILLKD
ncbi:MAG: PEP/pyruvate-binding domain-containing protein [Bacteroidales bacterium]|nr:PEP/pyruvate-binding domain-containing protein [Bacteroidales bacterium]